MISTLLPLLSLGCQPEIGADLDDTGAPTTSDCAIEIVETWPIQGTDEAYWRTDVEFRLSTPDETATVFADFEGTQSTRDDDHVIVFTPTVPLEPNTTYTVGLDYCRGAPEFSFTTSDYGSEIEDEGDLVNMAWSLDLASARFLDAEDLGELIANYLSNALLLGLAELTDDSLVLMSARSDGDEQDLCARTTTFPEATFDSPYFDLSASEVDVGMNEVQLHLTDFAFSGTFSADGTSIGGVRLVATGDARDAGEWLEINPDVICELAESVGNACEPCPDGEYYCGTVVADNLEATTVAGPLEQIDKVTDEDCP